MKHNYATMDAEELHDLYEETFGMGFAIQWDDESDHREDVIVCLESGVAQDLNAMSMDVPDGSVA